MSGPNAPAEYVQLAFLIDCHFPGYVDAYYGPPELKTQATTGDKPPLGALEDFAVSLLLLTVVLPMCRFMET